MYTMLRSHLGRLSRREYDKVAKQGCNKIKKQKVNSDMILDSRQRWKLVILDL